MPAVTSGLGLSYKCSRQPYNAITTHTITHNNKPYFIYIEVRVATATATATATTARVRRESVCGGKNGNKEDVNFAEFGKNSDYAF